MEPVTFSETSSVSTRLHGETSHIILPCQVMNITGYRRRVNFFTERHGCAVNTPVSFREVSGSNLDPQTGYPEGFPQSLQAHTGAVP
jgi:hypothetical protein